MPWPFRRPPKPPVQGTQDFKIRPRRQGRQAGQGLDEQAGHRQQAQSDFQNVRNSNVRRACAVPADFGEAQRLAVQSSAALVLDQEQRRSDLSEERLRRGTIASITKLMTAMVVLDSRPTCRLRPESAVTNSFSYFSFPAGKNRPEEARPRLQWRYQRH